MDLAAWRDLVIVIWGLVGVLVSIFFGIIIFLVYKKVSPLLESANSVVDKVGDIVDYTDKELIRPIIQFGSVVKGVAEVISLVSKLFKKKEEEDE